MGDIKINNIGKPGNNDLYPQLAIGSQGQDVLQLQTLLLQKGYKLTVDGVFGQETLNAVKSYQADNVLSIDGVAGPSTLAKLGFVIAPTPTAAPITQASPIELTKLQGIDVSAYQPNTNWQQVKANGCAFAFIKATEGVSFTNQYYLKDYENAKAQGIYLGAYHFFHPSVDPIKQADFFLSVAKNQASDLPPVLDWEAHEGTPAQELDSALKWLSYVRQKTNRVPIVYLSASYTGDLIYSMKQGHVNESDLMPLLNYSLWVAHYGVSVPKIPAPWPKWSFWQYQADAKYPGVTTVADLNQFNGSLADLQTFIAQSVAVKPADPMVVS